MIKSWTISHTSTMTCLAVSMNDTYINFMYTIGISESVINYGQIKILTLNPVSSIEVV